MKRAPTWWVWLTTTFSLLCPALSRPDPEAGHERDIGVVGHTQSWVYSGVAHIQFRVYSGVEYSHVYSTQLSRIYECILNTLYWVDTHTLYSAELNASALLYSAELSRTECLSMSIPIYSLPDCLWQINITKKFCCLFQNVWLVRLWSSTKICSFYLHLIWD